MIPIIGFGFLFFICHLLFSLFPRTLFLYQGGEAYLITIKDGP